jgi:hypothetical protein
MTLDTVRQAFEEWRANRSSGREQIPERLWMMVQGLLSDHKPGELRVALGINSQQLKRYCPEVNERKPLTTHDGFIETLLPSPSMDCKLTLQGSSRTLSIQVPVGQLSQVLPLLESYL